MIQKPEEPRQIFRLNSIDNLRPVTNYVVIKPIIKNINRERSGLKLITDPYKENPDHIDRIGIVMKLPERLTFDDGKTWKTSTVKKVIKDKTNNYKQTKIFQERLVWKNEQGSLGWDTDNELQEGDKVLFSYLEAINSPMILVKNEIYYLVKYDEIVAVKRENIIPLNGYLICEKVKKPVESKLEFKEEIDDRYLKVRYIGKPVRKYFGGEEERGQDIKTGDLLLKDDAQLKPGTEYLYHAEFFNSQEELVFLQRRYINAILN